MTVPDSLLTTGMLSEADHAAARASLTLDHLGIIPHAARGAQAPVMPMDVLYEHYHIRHVRIAMSREADGAEFTFQIACNAKDDKASIQRLHIGFSTASRAAAFWEMWAQAQCECTSGEVRLPMHGLPIGYP